MYNFFTIIFQRKNQNMRHLFPWWKLHFLRRVDSVLQHTQMANRQQGRKRIYGLPKLWQGRDSQSHVRNRRPYRRYHSNGRHNLRKHAIYRFTPDSGKQLQSSWRKKWKWSWAFVECFWHRPLGNLLLHHLRQLWQRFRLERTTWRHLLFRRRQPTRRAWFIYRRKRRFHQPRHGKFYNLLGCRSIHQKW